VPLLLQTIIDQGILPKDTSVVLGSPRWWPRSP